MSAEAERAQERGTSDMWRVLLAAPDEVGAAVRHAVAKRAQERGTSDMWRVLLAAPDEVGAI